jgi:hypothetical protein
MAGLLKWLIIIIYSKAYKNCLQEKVSGKGFGKGTNANKIGQPLFVWDAALFVLFCTLNVF